VSGKPGCKQVASLQFFIPDLPVMQTFQIDTTSRNSIINVNSQLDILRSVATRISFVPVTLVLRPRDATNPDTGKKVNIFVLDLIIDASLRNVATLQPLVGHDRMCAQAPSDALPDDLYARSQVAKELPAPSDTRKALYADIAKVRDELEIPKDMLTGWVAEQYGGKKAVELTEEELAELPARMKAAMSEETPAPKTEKREPGDESDEGIDF
jgi:hypothetical protein